MAKIKGVCKNIDDCTKAENREVQELEKSAPFVCEECGKPLVPLKNDNGGTKDFPLWMIIALAIVILGIAGGSIYYFAFMRNTEKVLVEVTEEIETEPIVVEPEEPIIDEPETIVEPLPGDQPHVIIEEGDQTAGSGRGTISFNYGKYTGDIKNFKANGTGVLQFYKPRRISMLDKQERMADTKDYVEGVFVDNELTQGKWYGADKNQKGAVLTGQVGVPEAK